VNFNVKARRRWLGAFFLLAAMVMLVAGETTTGKRLEGALFILYWLACFGFAALAMLVAVFDVRALRREIHAEQQAMLRNVMKEIEAKSASQPGPTATKQSRPPNSKVLPPR